MVDPARGVHAVVAAVQVGVAVEVGVVVEEARAVAVDVRLLQREQAGAREHRRRAARESDRVRGRVERRRRHVDLRRAEEIRPLGAGDTGAEDDAGESQEAPYHCAAITSASVKGIGLYSKRS